MRRWGASLGASQVPILSVKIFVRRSSNAFSGVPTKGFNVLAIIFYKLRFALVPSVISCYPLHLFSIPIVLHIHG